jgi:hypothetical protein
VPGIRYDEVARVHGAHLAGRGSFEEMLWRIAALESWHRRWVAGEVATQVAPGEPESEHLLTATDPGSRASALALS